jgi:hypothetical protein
MYKKALQKISSEKKSNEESEREIFEGQNVMFAFSL